MLRQGVHCYHRLIRCEHWPPQNQSVMIVLAYHQLKISSVYFEGILDPNSHDGSRSSSELE
jgi:hypothetical protein